MDTSTVSTVSGGLSFDYPRASSPDRTEWVFTAPSSPSPETTERPRWDESRGTARVRELHRRCAVCGAVSATCRPSRTRTRRTRCSFVQIATERSHCSSGETSEFGHFKTTTCRWTLTRPTTGPWLLSAVQRFSRPPRRLPCRVRRRDCPKPPSVLLRRDSACPPRVDFRGWSDDFQPSTMTGNVGHTLGAGCLLTRAPITTFAQP